VKWLLDSNVLSEQVRPRPKASVIAWIAGQKRQEIGTSIVVLAELRRGAAMADPTRRLELMAWIESEVSGSFAGRILTVTVEILIHWLELIHQTAASGRTRAPADLLIASTARVHDLILVTRKVRDFADTGVVVYDPWTDETHRMEQS
jgi:toxin FitB